MVMKVRFYSGGPRNVPLHLNSVTQFAAFSGLPNGLSEGGRID